MLDTFDLAILTVVQADNRLPNREIASRVSLSETAVRRRLERLRSEGIIQGDVALLDRDALGQTLIVSVVFCEDTAEAYARFRQQMVESSRVTQCYSIAGVVDFILIVHAPDLREFEAWAQTTLLSDPVVRRYETSVVFTTHKFSTVVPLG
ncbi:Lrp/AsnC family transcriptional regulator [uncultured Maricaulis sp.]|uniref:Lrp/AsnC family transcriptional regulator n=1 Tax=uncultured Maricaulis sp. TaxID=174710 RepID=UPI0030D805A5|tara:strand:+ start:7766 stop:8218 length:453 start_codon:yes stop_codon:yes gene_type:complete